LKTYAFHIKTFLVTILLSFAISHLTGQPLSFRHLNVNDGLVTNVVALTAFDRNGSLWFSTGEAINLYDGNNITTYHWRNYPFIPQAEVNFFSIDSDNRIWLCYPGQFVLIDENRRPQPYFLVDSLEDIAVSGCFEISGLGMVAITNKGTFYTNDIKKNWNRFFWIDTLLSNDPIVYLNKFDSSTAILRKGNELLLVDFKTKKLVLKISIPGSINIDACRINEDEILFGGRYKWELHRISVTRKKIIKTYNTCFDQFGKQITGELLHMEAAANNMIYFTTRFSGLVQFDPVKENFFVHHHDFFSQQTLATDNLRYLATNPDGYMAVSSRSGVSITNVFQPSFSSVEYFKEPDGSVIDEGVVGILQDNKKKLWLLTHTRLFTWKIGDDFVKPLLRLNDIVTTDVPVTPGIPGLDHYGRIWIPYAGHGILIYNDEGKLIKSLKKGDGLAGGLYDDEVRVVRKAPNDKMIVGSNRGIFIIDALTCKIDSITWKQLRDSMFRKRVVDIFPDGDHIWLTTSPNGAVYKFNTRTNELRTYTTESGIASRRNYLLAKDNTGNIYVSSYNGLTVFASDGKIKKIDEQSGLTDLRAEAVIADDGGHVWITNTGTLIRYHPVKNQFDYFNEQHGINKTGFQITPACKTSEGYLIFGLNRGIIIVDPNKIKPRHQPVKFSFFRVNTDNTIDVYSTTSTLNLPYNNGKVSFSYLNSDLISSGRIFYRYKMDGLDTTWSVPTRNHLIAYNLRPGEYRFQMQASYNETNWIDFPNSIAINVASPFWQQWWFYVLIGVLAIGTTVVVIRTVQSSKEQKRKLEELNRLMNESRLMAIRSQMNPHFIFNSLNAIQECIVMQDFDAAYQYLSKFSKLLRQVLNNSEKNFIPLKDEIEVNQLYLELESLRFKKSFTYSIDVEDNIDTETVKFPSLLLQPFIENAIWHGLMHKQGAKKLDISFVLENNHLECVIEDNGIGRERSADIKKNKLGSQYFESKGTKLSGQRIQLLNETGYVNASLQIEDLKDDTGEAKGTKVTLNLPLDYKS
jgi:ligand-binding sensor domain-containing protein